MLQKHTFYLLDKCNIREYHINMTYKNDKRTSLGLNAKLIKAAKVQAAAESITLTQLIEKALTAYIPHQTKKFISNPSILKPAYARRAISQTVHSNRSAAIADGLATDREKGPVIT